MPIRINLKEIFPSDPQEILVNKLNFNYNKLLELGVGTPGPTGLTGPQGAAGPIGLVGPQGDRGATWWVDSGDPNTLIFTGLIDGDLYLDQTSNVFQIWKYDDGTSTWNQVVSIAAIVNSYLSGLSTIPFETVSTFQAPGSTPVTKFILFDKRDDYVADATRGTANTSLNNMLFLNNFDETDITYPTLGQDQYNSLLSIFPAHDDTQDSGRAQSGRYHIEMGSLYMDNDILPVGTIQYSELKHNLKAKFYKQYIDPALPPYLPSTNTWINTAKFSLSFTESQSLLDIDQNGAFEFLFPKWNNEGASSIQEELSVVLSSAEAIVERSPAHTHIVADGIHVSTKSSSINATLGLALDFVSLNTKLDGKNHLMLDSNSGVDGVILLNKGAFVNGDMNIVDGLAIGSGYEDLTAPANSLIVEGRIGTGISSPSSSTNQHNYLTGIGASRSITYNNIEDLTLNSGAFLPAILYGTRTSIENIDGTPDPLVYLSSSAISGNNSITSLTGNLISLTGTTSVGTFIGSDISLISATSVLHSGDFYGTRIALDGSSDFSGANRQVYGNYFQFSPDLSAVTGGGSIRGNQIELSGYVPNSSMAAYGSNILIQQTSNVNQGAVYGNNIKTNINSLSSAASAVTGLNIAMNTDSPNYDLPNSSYAINIFNAGEIPASGETYGLKYDHYGTKGLGAEAYGYHISGATNNYAEGASRFKGSVAIQDDPSDTYVQYVKNSWSGTWTIGWDGQNNSATYYPGTDAANDFGVGAIVDYTSGTGGATSMIIYLDHTIPINAAKSVMHVTIRRMGVEPRESLQVIASVSLGNTQTRIDFMAMDGASTWDTTTLARLRFNYTLIETV
jgi:hypothetical protein